MCQDIPYSSKADVWVSTGTLVTRMNFGLSLASNRYPGIHTDWIGSNVPGAYGLTPAANQPAEEQRLEARLVPTGIEPKTRKAILNQALQQTAPMPITKPTGTNPAPVSPVRTPQEEAKLKSAAQDALRKQTSALEQQDALLAGLLIGSPEFQRR